MNEDRERMAILVSSRMAMHWPLQCPMCPDRVAMAVDIIDALTSDAARVEQPFFGAQGEGPIDRGVGEPCPDCGEPWPCGKHMSPKDPRRGAATALPAGLFDHLQSCDEKFCVAFRDYIRVVERIMGVDS